MSRSHKKCELKDLSLYSFTQKLRQPSLSQSKKLKKEKENINYSRSFSKFKQDSKATTDKKKKFLQGEVEKLLRKKYIDSDAKIREIKERNTQQICGLKQDLQQMKQVISKLAFEDKKPLKTEERRKESEGQLHMICLGYRRKISEMQQEINVQKMANAQLEEAHIQSQVFAQQTKDFSESIKQELQELASKHIKCEENMRDLEEARRAIRKMEAQRDQQVRMLQGSLDEAKLESATLKSNLQTATLENNKLQQQLKQMSQKWTQACSAANSQQAKIKQLEESIAAMQKRQSESMMEREELQRSYEQQYKEFQDQIQQLQTDYEQLQEEKQMMFQSFLDKVEQNRLQLAQTIAQKQRLQQQNSTNAESLIQLRQQLQQQKESRSRINSLQAQLKRTEIELNKADRVDMGGLASMEQKCSQLYEQIKREKLRWDLLNVESGIQKQNLQAQMALLATQRQSINQQMKTFQSSLGQSLKNTELLRIQKQHHQLQTAKLIIQMRQLKETLNKKQEQLNILKEQMTSIIIQGACEGEKSVKKQFECQKEKQRATQLQQDLRVTRKERDMIQLSKNAIQTQSKSLEKQNIDLRSQLSNGQDRYAKSQSSLLQLKKTLQSKSSQNTMLQLAIKQLKLELNELMAQRQLLSAQMQSAKQANCLLEGQKKAQTQQYESDVCKYSQQISQIGNEVKLWREKYTSCEKQAQSERSLHQQYKSRLAQVSQAKFQLTMQLEKLTDSTKRSNDQLAWYQKEISLKNRSIVDLKETIKLVREESLRIQQEVKVCQEEFKAIQQQQLTAKQAQQLEQLTAIAHKQLQYMKDRLDDLQSEKIDIQIQMETVTKNNEQLQQKINNLQADISLLLAQRQCLDSIQEEDQYSSLEQQQRQSLLSKLALLEQKLKEKDAKFYALSQAIESHKQQQNLSQALRDSIKEKDHIIFTLNQKNSAHEQKRCKIVEEIRCIQHQIAIISQKNVILEQENNNLQIKLKERELKLKETNQRLAILQQNQRALEEQKHALMDQAQLFRIENVRSKEREIQLQQTKLKEMKQLYQCSQQRSNHEIAALKESIHALKETMKELANELTSSINKLNSKNEQMERFKQKYSQIQAILKENHELLDEQRNERQKMSAISIQLNLCIENYKMQVVSKGKQIQSLAKEKSALKGKLVQLQSKYQILRGKYESIEQQKQHARKEIQNQSVTLRVLREENKNIEKVMSEQLNQRKTIIEQLVNEKKMLYSQLQH